MNLSRLPRFLLGLLLAGGLAPAWAGADLKDLTPRPAPALEQPLLEGGMRGLTELKGQVVLVNFWAVWCPPCRKEMPSMNRLAERLKDRPFAILGVNAGDAPADIRAFQKKVPTAFPILLDEDGVAIKTWNAFVFPTSFVVDKRGRVRMGLSGSIDWDGPEVIQRLDRLLAED